MGGVEQVGMVVVVGVVEVGGVVEVVEVMESRNESRKRILIELDIDIRQLLVSANLITCHHHPHHQVL